MHINEDISTLYSGKLAGVLLTSSTKSLIVPLKSHIQMDREIIQSFNNSSNEIQNTLVKYQCQKWQQFLDFDKILKQLRLAEKLHLRNKNELLHSLNNNGKNEILPNVIRSSSKLASLPSMKCTRQLRQVQRLSGKDMHYYGIAPNQTALNVIVCNMCFGFYTKVGFNNHMMLRHSSAWNAVPANFHNTSNNDVTSNVNQDFINSATSMTLTSEVEEASSELFGTISNSNASPYSPLYASTQRHKNVKNEATTRVNSSNSSIARLRSKHIKYKSNTPLLEFKIGNIDTCQMLNKKVKRSCVNSSDNVVTISSTTSCSINDNCKSLVNHCQPTAIYSSSSNSSCSLPPTPQMAINQLEIKSPSIISQESADSSTSNSSSEFDRTTLISKPISKKLSNISSFGNKVKPCDTTIGVSTKIPGKNVSLFNSYQLESKENKKKNFQCSEEFGLSNNSPQISSHIKSPYTINNSTKANPSRKRLCQLSHNVSQEVPESSTEFVTQNNSDDSSILTLDDVLDSKFINEILSTTESEMHFDENVLDGTSTHPQTHSQLASKRMCFDETIVALEQEQSSEVINYVSYQNQYAKYNEENADNIKVYNRNQQTLTDTQPYHQNQEQTLSTIRAIQIQQLLPQQQNFDFYENSEHPNSSTTLNDQQLDEQNSYDYSRHITSFGSTGDMYNAKLKTMPNKLLNISSMTENCRVYEEVNCDCDANFELFNIRSLTDKFCDTPNLRCPNIGEVVQRNFKQFVCHPVYEVADNNQATVLSHQQKKPMVNNFLNKSSEHIKQLNNHNSHQNHQNYKLPTNARSSVLMSAISKNEIDNNFDFQDSDFLYIESVKTVGIKNYNNVKNGFTCKPVHFNVFVYAEVPRPMSINCFGLIKLPFSMASTFKKHLLSTRKANNNPIILCGGLTGVVGPNSCLSNSKSIPNISNINGPLTNSSNNEFSIGSVTITSLSIPSNQIYPQPKQYPIASIGGNAEMIRNDALNSSVISPMLTLQRQKSKSSSSHTSFNVNASNYVKSKSQVNLMASTLSPYNRNSSRTVLHSFLQTYKTIHIYKNTTNANDKVKYVRGRLFISCKTDVTKKSKFASRQIFDILGGINKPKPFKSKYISDPKLLNNVQCVIDEHKSLGQAKHFPVPSNS